MDPFYAQLRNLVITCILSLTFGTTINAQCNYTINLFDSFGDGWNGAVLTVTLNGNDSTYTIEGGGDQASFTIVVSDGDVIILNHTSGDFPGEESYELLDAEGIVIFSDGPDPQNGEVLNQTLTCPTCLAPVNFLIEEVLGDGVELSFMEGDDSTLQYLITYKLVEQPDDSLQFFNTTSTFPLVSPLLQDTTYELSVSAICENGDTSIAIGRTIFTTPFLNDVGITYISSPISACELGLETVTLGITGYGSNRQSLFDFGYSVNGEVISLPMFTDGFFTGIVGSEDTVEVEFETRFDYSEPGLYEIAVWTSLEGDSDPSNDTAYYRFFSIPTVSELPYAVDFEANAQGWIVDANGTNNSWEYGTPNNDIISNAAGGTNAWVTSLNSNYNASENSSLNSVCYDFSTITTDPTFSLFISYDTETNYDGCWLEGSKDGGDTWEKIGTDTSGVNWYSVENTFTELGNIWAGESEGWEYALHTLDGYAGEPNGRFRFNFASDGSVQNEGCGIDNVRIFVPTAVDLSTIQATNDGDSQCGSVEDNIMLNVINTGFEAQSDFSVSYQVNNLPVVTEVVSDVTLEPNQSYLHSFQTPFNSNQINTEFNIRAWVNANNEEDFSNDTTSYIFSTATQAGPFVADFENGLPADWTTDGQIGNGHNNVSNVLFRNLYGSVPTFSTETSIVGPIEVGDRLSFDYRYSDFAGGTSATILTDDDKLEVAIGLACENTAPTVMLTINGSNHDPVVEMTNQSIDLSAYAGQYIKVFFDASHGAGDYFLDLDNINFDQVVNIEEVEQLLTYNLYPNPTNARASLNATFEKPMDVSVRVVNTLGQMMYHQDFGRTAIIQNEMNTAGWSKGIYFVQLLLEGQVYTQKLIRQ